ncbi:anti-sigma factor [Paraburkholderia phenoliruptrix]|uniref:anti-sigma factor n=1 Tax=Paraburkholderia phenoliruptrix TaxID=252970 RepID=UPI0034CF6ADE
MDCNEARPLLDANADHELPAPDARRVEQHIERCAACRRESDTLRTMSRALRAAPYHRAPESLRSRILAGLPQTQGAAREASEAVPASARAGVDGAAVQAEDPAAAVAAAAQAPGRNARPSSHRRPGWFRGCVDRLFGGRAAHVGQGGQGGQGGLAAPSAGGGAGAPLASGWFAPLVVALCAVGVALTLNLRRPAEFAPFADELVASHVRAQVSGRDIDVISTDRHTVKPWFNGRLDYSPPVEDLAASGFALEGGRLDYLAHRRVAVLVYRYRKHVIDVYVFPQTAGSAANGADSGAPSTLAREGYSLAHWDAEGMTWWAITDAAPDALSGFEAALKARLASASGHTENG